MSNVGGGVNRRQDKCVVEVDALFHVMAVAGLVFAGNTVPISQDLPLKSSVTARVLS